jgi:hypothetical protein
MSPRARAVLITICFSSSSFTFASPSQGAPLAFVSTSAPVSQAGLSTTCIGRAEVFRVRPGLSTEPNSGTITTEVQGIEECNGPVEGHQPTGIIRTSHGEVTYGIPNPATCSALLFSGWADHAIPTAHGTIILRNHFRGYFDPLSDPLKAGTIEGDRFSGRFLFRPVEGNCVTSALTRFEAEWIGTWHGKSGT